MHCTLILRDRCPVFTYTFKLGDCWHRECTFLYTMSSACSCLYDCNRILWAFVSPSTITTSYTQTDSRRGHSLGLPHDTCDISGCKHAHSNARKHAHTHTHTHTRAHTRAHTHTHALTHTYTRTQICSRPYMFAIVSLLTIPHQRAPSFEPHQRPPLLPWSRICTIMA